MKYFTLFVLVVLSVATTLNVQASSAYAEKPAVPNDVSKNFLAIGIEKSTVPDADQVRVPIYPNAKIINSYKGVKSPQGIFELLPFLELISTDSYDQVVGFYKEKLVGWQQGGFNTALYFAEKGKINMFSPKSTHVGIHDVLKYYRENEQKDLQKIIPGAKSLIKIFYTGK
ncbi:MAG: hypothetical protein GXP19_08585 [Gammaproteobacteria bacterium]|nr:hypothetical protein [Gammaproteobacteria bacterium]